MATTTPKILRKILFVQDSLGTGGAERSNANLWYHLRDKGITIKILVLEHRGVGIEEEIIEAGFDVVFIKKANPLKAARIIANHIKSFHPDLVHTVLFKATLRVRLAKLFSSFVLIESLVNCTYDPSRLRDQNIAHYKLSAYKILDKFSAHVFGDFYIPITDTVRDHYEKYLGLSSKRMQVIFRGRSENPFHKLEERNRIASELGLNAAKLWLTQVGRQEFQKGHIHTLKALCLLPDDVKDKIEVLFLGREGNASASLKVFLKENELGVDYYFPGHRNDVPQIMKASDIFLFPSLYEGLGGSLIEAQSASLPVICSDIPVLNEVVEKQGNALMFEAGNEQELAKKIQELVEKTELREEMGRHSLERFNKLFQIERIHEEMLEFYKVIMAKGHT